MTSEPTPQGTRLAGWKEIGRYLGKSARTVQRWEKELAFPIRRIRTPKGQIIYADRHEIDQWMERQSAGLLESGEIGRAGPVEASPASSLGALQRGLWWIRIVAVCAIAALAAVVLGLRHQFAGDRSRTPLPASAPAVIASAAAARGGDEVYVTLHEAIVVVDAAAGRVARTIPIPSGRPFSSLGPATITADGRALLLPTQENNGIAVFDLASEQFDRWFDASDRRLTRAVPSVDGKRILAVDKIGRLRILDAITGSQIDVVPVAGGESFDGTLNRRGDLFYLLNRDAGTVAVIDLETRNVVRTIATATGAHDIVLAANGARAFVTNEYAGSMSCLDAEEHRVIGTVAVERSPISLALDPMGRAVYVANRDSDSISIVNPVTCQVERTIRSAIPGSTVGAVGTNQDGSRVFAAGAAEPVLVEFDAVSWRPVATIRLPFEALTIVPSPIRSMPAPTAGAAR